MAHFLLFYTVLDDYLALRPRFREAHLAHARAAVECGELVLGGALDPADGAVLLFEAETAATAERFAAEDPYVRSGLVREWCVRGWTTVVGPMASVRLP